MPAYPSWFRVHPRVVMAQADATADLLADPAHTAALLDLRVVGVDGVVLRLELNRLRHELRTQLAWQAEASARLAAVQVERGTSTEAFFRWRMRLFARLRYAARKGADPERAFSKVFGYRRVPAPRAAGLVVAGREIFRALSERAASLQPHGVDAGFVTEGRTAHQRLVSLHEEVSDILADRKASTKAVRVAVMVLQEELLALVAADEAAALDADRAPVFVLDLLRPST